jgi:hypothetical protein
MDLIRYAKLIFLSKLKLIIFLTMLHSQPISSCPAPARQRLPSIILPTSTAYNILDGADIPCPHKSTRCIRRPGILDSCSTRPSLYPRLLRLPTPSTFRVAVVHRVESILHHFVSSAPCIPISDSRRPPYTESSHRNPDWSSESSHTRVNPPTSLECLSNRLSSYSTPPSS